MAEADALVATLARIARAIAEREAMRRKAEEPAERRAKIAVVDGKRGGQVAS